jgi:hypothetical protein
MVRVEGLVDKKTMRALIGDIAAIMQEHDCDCMLDDVREVTVALSTIDIFAIPHLADEAGLQKLIRRALVVRDENDDFEFLETASVNRGQNLRIFTDIDEAKRWVHGESDE